MFLSGSQPLLGNSTQAMVTGMGSKISYILQSSEKPLLLLLLGFWTGTLGLRWSHILLLFEAYTAGCQADRSIIL